MSKSRKRVISILLMLLSAVLITSSLTACRKEEQPEEEEYTEEGNMMYFALPSDSDNGYVWTITQENKIFTVEEDFIEEVDSDEDGDIHRFFLIPNAPGNTTLLFSYEDSEGKQTKYSYEVTVNDKNEIKVTESSGEYDGEPVEPVEFELLPIEY